MKQKRISSSRITELKPDEIFVFGSNLEGLHGGGAAYLAYRKWGAIWGQGVGLQGQTYGIPTMHGGPDAIRPYVDEFIKFAQVHPELKFLVTEIGCGIAGFWHSRLYTGRNRAAFHRGDPNRKHLSAGTFLAYLRKEINDNTP